MSSVESMVSKNKLCVDMRRIKISQGIMIVFNGIYIRIGPNTPFCLSHFLNSFSLCQCMSFFSNSLLVENKVNNP